MRLTRLLAVLGIALAWLVLTPAPSYACSCAQMTTDGQVETADVVVRGTIDAREPGGSGTVTYAVTTSGVYKGDAARHLEVVSADSGASCGLEDIALGEEHVVFAYAEQERLWANLCGGTAPATAELLQNVERSTGPPSSPSAGGTAPLDAPRAQTSAGPPVWPWTAGFVGAGALGSMLVLVMRRRPGQK